MVIRPYRTKILTAALVVLAVGIVWWWRAFFDRHEGTAAWVQALGAILIIGATARIAGRNSRESRKRERRARDQTRESIVVLARNCLEAIDTLLKNFQPPGQQSYSREKFLSSYAPSDFDVPMDGLAAVPLHQLDDAALITAVLTLRGIMGRIKKHLDDATRDSAFSPALETVRNLRTLAFNAVASVLRIVKGHIAEQEISRLASRM